MLGRPVAFADDCVGEKAAAAINAMRSGEVLCLENTRFHEGEERNDPAFVGELAALGDVFVNDAFGGAPRPCLCRRIGPPTSELAGRAMQQEIEALTMALETPARPLAAIVGGAKISSKLDLLGNLLAKVDTLVIGGAMANTFLAARGKPVGKSLCEHALLPTARDILAKAQKRGCEIVLPVDVVVAEKLEANALSRRYL